jgi:hypothetical protein
MSGDLVTIVGALTGIFLSGALFVIISSSHDKSVCDE